MIERGHLRALQEARKRQESAQRHGVFDKEGIVSRQIAALGEIKTATAEILAKYDVPDIEPFDLQNLSMAELFNIPPHYAPIQEQVSDEESKRRQQQHDFYVQTAEIQEKDNPALASSLRLSAELAFRGFSGGTITLLRHMKGLYSFHDLYAVRAAWILATEGADYSTLQEVGQRLRACPHPREEIRRILERRYDRYERTTEGKLIGLWHDSNGNPHAEYLPGGFSQPPVGRVRLGPNGEPVRISPNNPMLEPISEEERTREFALRDERKAKERELPGQ